MRPPLKLLLSALCAGAVISLAVFGWSIKAKDDATFHLANGVEVTPIEVKQDDMAELLEARIWKFDALLPDPDNSYEGISLYRKGQPSQQVSSGMGLSPIRKGPHHSDITVGLAPIGGSFRDALKLKFYLSNGAGSQAGTIPNPFIHSRGVITWNPEAVPEKNAILFVTGNPQGGGFSDPISRNDVALALDFSVFPYKK